MTRRSFPLAFAPAGQSLDYEVWDVFTDRPLAGNQLGVFFNAAGLSTEAMLAITREMNFSECTFVEKGFRVRIFSRTQEMPFAGHPTLGTAFALWNRAGRKPARITLELNIGPVPVDFTAPSTGIMIQPEPVFGEKHEAAVIAKLIGVHASDIDPAHPIQNVSTGRPNLIVMLKSLKALQSVQYDWPAIDAYFASGDRQRGFYLITQETRDKTRQFHTRKLAKGYEDAVTGSAAGSAIAWLVEHGVVPSGKQVIFEQGTEIQREGQAMVSAEKVNGKTTRVRVGGSSVLVMQGKFRW